MFRYKKHWCGWLTYLPIVKNIATAAPPIAIKVTQRIVFGKCLAFKFTHDLFIDEILRIKNISGTAATPFKTAA